ncbi:hypothetical protein T484DRAFT_1763151 [Baffinella frigidus]|nr:hypothetical protein T484DRAFT_1763151 [Cryptophyta sp. CCMP2293]
MFDKGLVEKKPRRQLKRYGGRAPVRRGARGSPAPTGCQNRRFRRARAQGAAEAKVALGVAEILASALSDSSASEGEPRTAPPELAAGKDPMRYGMRQYEADKSLQRIFSIADGPLTKQPVYGRPVTASALLGKDKNHEGVTFTANMQPKIDEGHYVEIFFNCVDLVEMWVVEQFGHPKSLAKPTAFGIVAEQKTDGKFHNLFFSQDQ